jgi:hypothetical protein
MYYFLIFMKGALNIKRPGSSTLLVLIVSSGKAFYRWGSLVRWGEGGQPSCALHALTNHMVLP